MRSSLIRFTISCVVVLVNAQCTSGSLPSQSNSSRPSPSFSVRREALPSPSVSPRGAGHPAGIDITVAAAARPNTGLRVGSEIEISMSFRSNGPAFADLAGGITLGSGLIWRIIKKPPGSEEEGDLCGPAPAGSPRCGRSGASIRAVSLRPHERKVFEFVAQVIDYRCPGYGDFWSSVFAGHFGNLRRGPQSFEMFLLFDNEPAEYDQQKRARGETPPASYEMPCDPHTVGLSG